MDKFSLLAANSLILTVFAVSFLAAFHDVNHRRFWRMWSSANLLLAAAFVFYITEAHLPEIMVFLVPNGLLIAAFALYNQSARRFNNRPRCRLRLWIPLALLVAISIPAQITDNYAITYTVTNLLLAFLSLATAAEYWSERLDGLSSRYGLVVSFSLMAISFALRVAQGFTEGPNMGLGLPDDALLSLHLVIGLIFVTASGAFSLALVFERKTAEQHEAAHRDPLTGAFNRRELTLRLKALLDLPVAPPFAIIQFDLDHFKSVNDRFGHGAGDEALQLCSDVMQWHLREKDCLARIGGEEFAALMPDISHSEAVGIAERIRTTISEMPLHFAPEDVRLTLSAGIYHGQGHGMDHKQLLQLADQGLYRSKNLGRNRVSLVMPAGDAAIPANGFSAPPGIAGSAPSDQKAAHSA